MAQHSIMSILLFVCLSLCFGVAQSQLQPVGGPCMTNSQCGSRCCVRSTPQGSGQCAARNPPFQSCYGPDIGDACSNSSECDSGCCVIDLGTSKTDCALKQPKLRCIGPNDGNACYSSAECNSGCCYKREFPRISSSCGPKVRGRECVGPNNGNPCNLNAGCDSGCCRTLNPRDPYRRICQSRAAENATCDLIPFFGKYNNCLCEGGFTCRRNQNNRFSCQKPSGK
ncbi:leucine-rich colipase-like protein 1 [Eleutherodactylus coqui]|uniref:leucine-rich colipase-like protein 1 n=1 Tax=Eleutherodactylus coqui TaxID=57060 RepID=UPI00346186F5